MKKNYFFKRLGGSTGMVRWMVMVGVFVVFGMGQGVRGANRYSVAIGNWNATSTWSDASGGASGFSVPVAGDVVYIQNGKNVTVTADAAAASITFTGAAATLTINNGATLSITGDVILLHNKSNSTACLITGGGTLSCASVEAGSNLTLNTSGWSAIITSTLYSFNISGNVTMIAKDISPYGQAGFRVEDGTTSIDGQITSSLLGSSNSAAFRMTTGAQTGTLVLGGDTPWGTLTYVTVALNGTSSTVEYSGTSTIIHGTTYTNLKINTAGTATLGAPTTVAGTFFMTQGTFALNGKTLTYGTSASLNYDGIAAQTTGVEWPATFAKNVTITNNSEGGVTLNESKTYNTAGTITVNGNMKFSTFNILGTGAFTLASGGSISSAYVTNGEGFGTSGDNTKGSIRVSGSRSFSTGGNYTLNGLAAQNTGTNMPATVNNLTINNAIGVTLSQATAVNGTLSLTGGTLTGTLTYGANGILKYNGTGYTTTSDVEFPASSGPKDLNITIANASGISLHGNRSLAGAMTIASGQKFIIPASMQFTVNGALTNNGGTSGLVVNSGGSLIQNSAVSATVERSVSAWGTGLSASQGWHFLSSPVTAQPIADEFTNVTPANYDFYTWYETTNEWVNFKNTTTAPTWNTANGSTSFTVGKGYLVGYAADGTKSFSGTLNKDNVNVTNLAISAGTNHGWHLLGNPFTSALTWGTSDWSLNNVTATAKIWDATAASYTDVATNGKIPALNGFMVQVTNGTNSLAIPTNARAHDATSWYKSGDRPSIELAANDISGQTSQQSIVRFDNLATNGFDPEFDSHFLAGYAPMFYSVAGEDLLSTNALPETGGTVQIPFNFIKNEGTSFTIEARTISNISGPVILNDLLTHAKQDLTVNPVYSFTSATEDNPSRFLLTFSHVGVGEVQAGNAIRVFAVNNSIMVLDNSGKNIGNVYVYNTMGQMIAKAGLDGNSMCKLNLNAPTGYYLVKVVTGEQAVSAKVFINKQ